MIDYLLTSLLVLCCWMVYSFVIKPKREAENYIRYFRNKGYKVLEIPFQPFGMPVFKQFKKDRQFGD